MPHARLRIEVKGIVQGVGFRPFVYNLAERLKLSGHILNNKLGVNIEIEGEDFNCRKFLESLESEPPPLARIAEVNAENIPPKKEKRFRILHSDASGEDITLISPDNDVCHNCFDELLDTKDRRYRYPFINCTDCGPRYTLIRKTPYDRPYTSMSVFKMCPDCQAEYDQPKDRRFHAQPNACPVCGPHVELLDANGIKVESDDPVANVARLLSEGKIVAIKGIGGYHIACDATNEQTVMALRDRKMRKEKPLAVMSKDIESIKRYAFVNAQEERLLKSREKPIVLLKKKEGILANAVAPKFNEYGVFLPYTPIHHLLFAYGKIPPALVMTSGNLSDEPIVFDESRLFERLGGIADFFLVNNRPIVWRCDDSVVRTFKEKTLIIRRSRGWVPEPIFTNQNLPPMLACGGDLKSVFCLAKGNTLFPGPHIGDLEHAEAFNSFKESIEHFKKIFEIEPEIIIIDKHPGYFSSNYGRSLGKQLVEVQHHYAHIAAVMLENRLKGDVIGLSLDGTGYGDDGTIWGGEILLCNLKGFERRFHFPTFLLPGGDKAAKEPWRTAISILYQLYGENIHNPHERFVEEVGEAKINNIIAMLKTGVNCHLTSSAGRLFDAVASILMVSHFNRFEGHSPMLLEAVADSSVEEMFGFEINKDGEIDFRDMISRMVEIANGDGSIPRCSAIFHNTIAGALGECCLRIRKETGIKNVCLGGGTFQNLLLLKRLTPMLEKDGFKVYLPRQLPVNDGGLAVGQLAIAAAKL